MHLRLSLHDWAFPSFIEMICCSMLFKSRWYGHGGSGCMFIIPRTRLDTCTVFMLNSEHVVVSNSENRHDGVYSVSSVYNHALLRWFELDVAERDAALRRPVSYWFFGNNFIVLRFTHNAVLSERIGHIDRVYLQVDAKPLAWLVRLQMCVRLFPVKKTWRRRLALAMGLHSRLGSQSLLRVISLDLMRTIALT